MRLSHGMTVVAGDRADILQFRMNGGAIEILALWVGGHRIEKDGSATSQSPGRGDRG
jgi:hypothetical protein